MSDLLQLASKQHAILVTFLWPAPLGDDFGDLVLEDGFSSALYTNWSEALAVGADDFASVPELGVEIGESTGRFEDGDHTLEMPLLLSDGTDAFPVDTLTSEPAHARTEVHIEEVLPGDDTTRRTLGYGWISKARKGILGRSGQARLVVRPVKSMLRNRVLGLPMTDRCPHRFGDNSCKVEIVRPGQTANTAIFANQEAGTISAISGNVITITGLTTTATTGHWFLGWVQVAGLRLRINQYTTGTSFGLGRRPPASWVGQNVIATPGCMKTPSRCNEWGNILNFGQPGIWMPTRFVRLEVQGPVEVQPE